MHYCPKSLDRRRFWLALGATIPREDSSHLNKRANSADGFTSSVFVPDFSAMAGLAHIDPTLSAVVAFRVKNHRVLLLAGAILCLLSAWYFALAIAPSALGARAPNVRQGLLPEWVGCREILHGRSPYRIEVTQQVELTIYGDTVSADSLSNQHRFAYPVPFIFLFFPIALLPFEIAQWTMLAACLVMSLLSVAWWAGQARLSNLDTVGLALMAFAAYPTVVGLQLRQPTMIVAALLAFSVFCARSRWLVLAGMIAAVTCCKPQLAIAVLLPLLAWAICSWRSRKAFPVSLAASLLVLASASELLVPGWITPWLGTVRAYSHYAGATPLLAELTHGHLFIPAALLLIAAIVWVSFEFSGSDLLFSVSFSIAAFQLLFPFQVYNEVLLLPAALWAAMNRDKIRERGQLHVLLFGCAWIALGSGWIATLALSLLDIVAPGAGVKLWQLPLVAAWLYPMLLFAALAAFAVSSGLAQRRTGLARSITA